MLPRLATRLSVSPMQTRLQIGIKQMFISNLSKHRLTNISQKKPLKSKTTIKFQPVDSETENSELSDEGDQQFLSRDRFVRPTEMIVTSHGTEWRDKTYNKLPINVRSAIEMAK